MDNMDNMDKLLMGFFLGLFIGWVLGILSAPQSGKETMDSIGEQAIELRDRATDKAEQVRHSTGL
jgi:gas vesicle protein